MGGNQTNAPTAPRWRRQRRLQLAAFLLGTTAVPTPSISSVMDRLSSEQLTVPADPPVSVDDIALQGSDDSVIEILESIPQFSLAFAASSDRGSATECQSGAVPGSPPELSNPADSLLTPESPSNTQQNSSTTQSQQEQSQPLQPKSSLLPTAQPAAQLPDFSVNPPYSTSQISVSAPPSLFMRPGQRTISVPVRLITTVSVGEAVTDNVQLSPTNKTADSISIGAIGVDLTIDTHRTLVEVVGSAAYQRYLNTSKISGFGTSVLAYGREAIINHFLYLEGNASISDELANQTLGSAISRPTSSSRVRTITYLTGPYLTSSVGDFADVSMHARHAEVHFQNLGGGPLPTGLADSNINQVTGLLDTAEHIRRYEMKASGEYLKQGGGFVLYNGLYSLFLGNTSGFQILGRAGYESIKDPGVTDLNGIIWSAGFVDRPGKGAYVRVEYGERFKKPTWNGFATIPLTPKLTISGQYLRTLETTQARLTRSLTDLTDQNAEPGISISTLPVPINLNLISGTFLTDDAILSLTWLPDAPGTKNSNLTTRISAGSSVTLTAAISRRRDQVQNFDDRDLIVAANYTQTLTTRASLTASVGYDKLLRTSLGAPKTAGLHGDIGVLYSVTKSVTATLIYAHQENYTQFAQTVRENAIEFSLTKTF